MSQRVGRGRKSGRFAQNPLRRLNNPSAQIRLTSRGLAMGGIYDVDAIVARHSERREPSLVDPRLPVRKESSQTMRIKGQRVPREEGWTSPEGAL